MSIDILFFVVLAGLVVCALGYAVHLVLVKRRKKKRHPLDIRPSNAKSATAPKS